MDRLTPEQVDTFARLLRDETKYSSRINPEVLTMLIQAARDLPVFCEQLESAQAAIDVDLYEANCALREQLEAAEAALDSEKTQHDETRGYRQKAEQELEAVEATVKESDDWFQKYVDANEVGIEMREAIQKVLPILRMDMESDESFDEAISMNVSVSCKILSDALEKE